MSKKEKGTKRIVFRTKYMTYTDCYLIPAEYEADGSLGLLLESETEGSGVTLTTWIPAKMYPEVIRFGRNAAFVDTNNVPGAMDLIREYRLGKNTGLTAQSGYCEYPLVVFNMEEIGKYKKEDA